MEKSPVQKAHDLLIVLSVFEMYPLSPATLFIILNHVEEDKFVLSALHSAIPRIFNIDKGQFDKEVSAILQFMKNNGVALYGEMKERLLKQFGLKFEEE